MEFIASVISFSVDEQASKFMLIYDGMYMVKNYCR